MESNGSVSAQAGVGQTLATYLNAEKRAKQGDNEAIEASRPFHSWRLLFVHENLGEFGGAETNIQLAAGELLNRGHAVGLVYERRTGRNEHKWKSLFNPCFEVPDHGKIEAVLNAIGRFQPDLIYLHKLKDLGVLEALLQTRMPVVRMIHDHSLTCLRTYKYNYFTRKICQRAVSPYCVFPCLATIERNHGGKLPVRWESYPRKQREMALTKRCTWLFVYSEYQKQDLVRNGFDPLRIDICAPVRPAKTCTGVTSHRPNNTLLYVGQIIRGKGVDVLLQALAQVRVPFQCSIVGDGNHRSYCERLCARLGLEKSVHFCGYVSPGALERFYREANVFLMSSLWPEPFGMAGPEAMHYGLPVVAFDVGGIREWLLDGENGLLVPWGDTAGFAAQIEALLCDPDLAHRLGKNGQEGVKQFDPGPQLNRMENLFNRLIRRAQGQQGQSQVIQGKVAGL